MAEGGPGLGRVEWGRAMRPNRPSCAHRPHIVGLDTLCPPCTPSLPACIFLPIQRHPSK